MYKAPSMFSPSSHEMPFFASAARHASSSPSYGVIVYPEIVERSNLVNSTWKFAVSVICLGADQSPSISPVDLNVRIDIQTIPSPSGIESNQIGSFSPVLEPFTVG